MKVQETFATGEAIGQFGELLERSGVDLEKFNEGLAKAEKNGTATNYVLEQLADTGLRSTYEEYLENNKAITDYNEAQVESQLKMAELGKALTPLATNFLNFKNTLIDVALGNKTVSEAFSETTKSIGDFATKAIQKGKEVIPGFVKELTSKVPDIVKSGAEMISKLGTSIGDNLPKLVEKGKDAVDRLTKGIGDNLPTILKSGVDLLSGLIKGITESLPTIATMGLTIVKNLVTALIKNLPTIITSGVSLITSLLSGLISALPEIVSFIVKDFIPSIVNTIKDQDWKSVGSDIINGLVAGLIAVGSDAVKAITGIASDMIEGAKEILGIHSPSREFKKIGLWTGEGMIVGLNDSNPKVNAAMSDMLNGILGVSNDYQKEYQQLIKEGGIKASNTSNAALKKIQSIESAAAKKKRALTKSELAEIEKLRKQANDTKNANQYKQDKKYIAMVEAAEKEYLDVVKRYIEDKKSTDELSLLEESRIWEQSIELFVVGSAQRIAVQKEYKKSLEAIYKEINSINEDFTKRALDLDTNYLEKVKNINEEYQKEWQSRKQSLSGFASTFEEMSFEFGVSSQHLIENLQTQVWAFENWEDQMNKLSARGLAQGIINEVQEIGPTVLPTLVALNRMTDDQLDEYNKLYETKQRQITERVDKELSEMKKNTEAQLRAVKTIHEGELADLRDLWNSEIKSLVTTTQSNLSSMKQVGTEAGRNLLNGLKSMQSPLQAQAKSMGETIKNTLERALDLDSINKSIESTSKKTSAEVSNPLKNATMNLGLSNTPSNSSINSSKNSSSNNNIVVNPAPVILNGKQVANVIFDDVSKNQARSTNLLANSIGVVT